MKKNVATVYVRECSAYVLFQEFYGFTSYVYYSMSKNPDFKKGQNTQIDIFSKKVYRQLTGTQKDAEYHQRNAYQNHNEN